MGQANAAGPTLIGGIFSSTLRTQHCAVFDGRHTCNLANTYCVDANHALTI